MLFSNHYHSNEKIKVNRSSYLQIDHQFLEKKAQGLICLGFLKFFKHYALKISGPRVGINILIYPIVLTKFIKIKKLKGTH